MLCRLAVKMEPCASASVLDARQCVDGIDTGIRACQVQQIMLSCNQVFTHDPLCQHLPV